jgi:hypothetical protein
MLLVTQVSDSVVSRLPFDSSLTVVERQVIDAVKKACKTYNSRIPEVICIAHESDPRAAHIPQVADVKNKSMPSEQLQQRSGTGSALPKASDVSPIKNFAALASGSSDCGAPGSSITRRLLEARKMAQSTQLRSKGKSESSGTPGMCQESIA